MHRLSLALAGVVLALGSATAQPAHSPNGAGKKASGPPPLYKDLGDLTHPVTTKVPRAQQYFDQGLRLCFAFNHFEASRAFREAARLDPQCAMAWWGVAYAAGPNINMPMDEANAAIANEAITKARALAPKANARDRAYIEALSTRYSTDAGRTRAGLDSAYANAMRTLVKSHPDDVNAAVLCAESLLDLSPWNQWARDGKPKPGTEEIVERLEAVMKSHPKHPGAIHYYIHAVEASPNPERAVEPASRLGALMPGAGHLVHMPSHIDARVARYDAALRTNETAIKVDEKYFAGASLEGSPYPHMYYNHNIHFVWFSGLMEGRSAKALDAARKLASNLPPELVAQMPMVECWPPIATATLARFGRWEEVLKEPAPPRSQRYATAVWYWARGLAYAGLGQLGPARAALDSVEAVQASIPEEFTILQNHGKPLLQMAAGSLEGAIAVREKRWDEAVKTFQSAIVIEDGLNYDEPPTWYFPVRHQLGAALLAAGRAADAEAVFRADLQRHPENGWSLYGLTRALEEQGKKDDARAIDERFKKAWARADMQLTTSAF